jgi:hypothetical protein
MENEINKSTTTIGMMLLMLAFMERSKYYTYLVDNEGKNKYILCIVNYHNKKQEVALLTISDIDDSKDLRKLSNRVTWEYCGKDLYVLSYLSEVKTSIDNLGANGSKLTKPLK